MTPWPSEPCNSASVIRSATVAASAGGRPRCWRALARKRRTCAAGKRESGIAHSLHEGEHRAIGTAQDGTRELRLHGGGGGGHGKLGQHHRIAIRKFSCRGGDLAVVVGGAALRQ